MGDQFLERQENDYDAYFFVGGGSIVVDYVFDYSNGNSWAMYNAFDAGAKMVGRLSAGLAFGTNVAKECQNAKTDDPNCWGSARKLLGLVPGAAIAMNGLASYGAVGVAGFAMPTGVGFEWSAGVEYAWQLCECQYC